MGTLCENNTVTAQSFQKSKHVVPSDANSIKQNSIDEPISTTTMPFAAPGPVQFDLMHSLDDKRSLIAFKQITKNSLEESVNEAPDTYKEQPLIQTEIPSGEKSQDEPALNMNNDLPVQG